MRLFSPPTIDVLYLGQKRLSFHRQVKQQLKEYTHVLGDILQSKK